MARAMKKRTTQQPRKRTALMNLPDELLLHILSSFTYLQILQTSLVSKQWNSLCRRALSFCFNFHVFLVHKNFIQLPPDEKFTHSVDEAIKARRCPIHTFSLSFPHYCQHTDLVEGWLRKADTRLHAREIHLDFFVDERYNTDNVEFLDRSDDEFLAPAPDEDEEENEEEDDEEEDVQDEDDDEIEEEDVQDDHAHADDHDMQLREDKEIEMYLYALSYEFSLDLLHNSNVQVLWLRNCWLVWPDENNFTMRVGLLQSIHLDMTNLTDKSVPSLVEWCPCLEELSLKNILGVKNLRVISAKLKKVVLEYVRESSKYVCESMVINYPALLTLKFYDCKADQIVFQHGSSIAEFSVDFSVLNGEEYHVVWCKFARLLRNARNVERLKMTNLWFKLLTPEFNLLPKNLKFRNLKHLELRTGYGRYDRAGTAALLQRLTNLEELVFSSIDTMKEDGSLSDEVLKKPLKLKRTRTKTKIKKVKLPLYSGTNEEKEFVKILEAQGLAKRNIKLGSR